ncbi:bifunctional phosphopantothenoylcysteine decarboxylase/phosphopantothenate--cysteine ligase CoaBC [Planctobacterium marinum]|uniref:Coenzyme A biosynthesis bifunctional protein CoaBC n=1 Tax=Planctobacterium marinum TaxID=1631968 RepID=A0AA48HRJ3_9ALTE|nr:phosphopantothenoylcysteine decarboxylase [Planctobacterium marinum]
MGSLLNTNILLGISGGIAAYKTPDLVRKLKARGANVRVVLTQSAKEFVSPLSLQAVSGNIVSDDLLDPAAEAAMGHIELAKWADLLLIAPATANTIAKLTHGLADDLLTTLVLATTAPIHLAPAMNQQMWRAPATQENLAILAKRNVSFIGPDQGEQACGDIGPGRMIEPEEIAELLDSQTSSQLLAGKKVIITAGPTREHIDPVRYMSNHSSGKMGYAIAEAALKLGAEVCLVSGPVNLNAPTQASLHKVNTAEEMLSAVMAEVQDCDIFIGCAAVADYKPTQAVDHKIKKSNIELTLTFVRNPDILASVAALPKPPFTVGFAAETQNVAQYAKDKLARKKLDLIAANDVSRSDIGFNSDENALTLYWADGEQPLAKANKQQIALQLLEAVAQRFNQKHS